MEGQILSYEVERSGGTFGSVLVTWEVQSTLSRNDNVIDFTPYTNAVLFGPQTTSQVNCKIHKCVLSKCFAELYSYCGQ